jgi:hypothetical protein
MEANEEQRQVQLEAIGNEIISMSLRDQEMRKSQQWDASIDHKNTARMKEIGWPTQSKVGVQASNMAWLLVQHADHEREFQKMCLNLMKAQPQGEVVAANIAYLEDRVRVGEGRPQLYGTQFYGDEHGNFGPSPIEDIDNINQRREAVGLAAFEDYSAQMNKIYQERKP